MLTGLMAHDLSQVAFASSCRLRKSTTSLALFHPLTTQQHIILYNHFDSNTFTAKIHTILTHDTEQAPLATALV